MKNYERELPTGYREVLHVNALDTRTGLILNLVALVIMALVIAVGFIPIFLGAIKYEFDFTEYIIAVLSFLLSIIIYMVWHELMHGAAYKLLTGEKLTFGMSWSCAFCGVPNIYVYRSAALISLLTPFVVCGILLVILTVVLAYVNVYAYAVALLVTAMHFGGCAGDLWVTLLYITRLRDRRTLMRDTGPEQFFYQPSDTN